MSSADEQEGDGQRFVREIRTNMKAPAVKATGKVTTRVSQAMLSSKDYHLDRSELFVSIRRGLVFARSL